MVGETVADVPVFDMGFVIVMKNCCGCGGFVVVICCWVGLFGETKSLKPWTNPLTAPATKTSGPVLKERKTNRKLTPSESLHLPRSTTSLYHLSVLSMRGFPGTRTTLPTKLVIPIHGSLIASLKAILETLFQRTGPVPPHLTHYGGPGGSISSRSCKSPTCPATVVIWSGRDTKAGSAPFVSRRIHRFQGKDSAYGNFGRW